MTPCRYFLVGRCRNGDGCLYDHVIAHQRQKQSSDRETGVIDLMHSLQMKGNNTIYCDAQSTSAAIGTLVDGSPVPAPSGLLMINEAYLKHLHGLISSPELLQKKGYILSPLTSKELEGRKRCTNCGKRKYSGLYHAMKLIFQQLSVVFLEIRNLAEKIQRKGLRHLHLLFLSLYYVAGIIPGTSSREWVKSQV